MNHVKMLCGFGVLGLAILGCAQQGSLKAGSQMQDLAALSAAEREIYYTNLCVGRGFEPGGEAFFNCVVDADQNYRLALIRRDFADGNSL